MHLLVHERSIDRSFINIITTTIYIALLLLLFILFFSILIYYLLLLYYYHHHPPLTLLYFVIYVVRPRRNVIKIYTISSIHTNTRAGLKKNLNCFVEKKKGALCCCWCRVEKCIIFFFRATYYNLV